MTIYNQGKTSVYHIPLLLLFLSSFIIHAKIELPAIVSSNMVLQRNTTVKVWGWADKGEKITITASWLSKPVQITTNNEGEWITNLKTTNTKEPQTISLKSNASDIILKNVVFGEVWLCSGQSNMNFGLVGNPGQPVYGSVQTIANSRNKNLRLFTVKKSPSLEPTKKLHSKNEEWTYANPNTVPEFSAIAYFFGSQLQKILDVPVGMIHSSWGASPIQAWMSKEVLEKHQQLDFSNYNKKPNKTNTVLFNGMINPITSYTIKGALWYQGEANRPEPQHYTKLMSMMVKEWRAKWDIGDFPFYYVQIAPFSSYKAIHEYNNYKNAAFLREAQLKAMDIIPNSFMACTMDIGSKISIHPPRKKEVADRLLNIALHKTYNYKTIDFSGPIFDSMETKDNGLLLKFKYAENGLYAFESEHIEGFEIAGEDKVFYPAEAKIINKRHLFISNENVANPKAARYGWQNWIKGSLFDCSLLPAPSFRTDNWDKGQRSQ
ncbi:sialate O-acetylesterase [Aquimarina algicola]|uniref:Sialate O-acetylesterase n=1 Tax=Aquimarina algicola TaxID=2589995 RepID=A0A504JAK3_9FLAO|nr:sialate O-acetylesterase [Aquimarina algicola]TPN83929.1 sialate O-acetylesterase [Aquimarina algicola]